MKNLTKEKIEIINSCGPFNHGHWDGKGISATNEEGLVGRADFLVKKIISYIDKTKGDPESFLRYKNEYELEIVKNLRFNPCDKIALEQAKFFYSKKQYEDAIRILEEIVQKINSDWRCVYRSFYLLAKIYKRVGNLPRSRYCGKLCRMANPNLPLII